MMTPSQSGSIRTEVRDQDRREDWHVDEAISKKSMKKPRRKMMNMTPRARHKSLAAGS